MASTVIIIMKCSSHEKMLILCDGERLSGAGQEYNAEVHTDKTELQDYKLICSKHHWTYILLAYHRIYIQLNKQWKKINKLYKGTPITLLSWLKRRHVVYSGGLNCCHMWLPSWSKEITQIRVYKVSLWPQSLQEFTQPYRDQSSTP